MSSTLTLFEDGIFLYFMREHSRYLDSLIYYLSFFSFYRDFLCSYNLYLLIAFTGLKPLAIACPPHGFVLS